MASRLMVTDVVVEPPAEVAVQVNVTPVVSVVADCLLRSPALR